MNLNKVNKFYRQSEKDRQLLKRPLKQKNNKPNEGDQFVKIKSFLIQEQVQSQRLSILSKQQKGSSMLRSSSLHSLQGRKFKPLFFGMNQKQFLDVYINDPFARQKINYTIKSQMKNMRKKSPIKKDKNKNEAELTGNSTNFNNLQTLQKLKISQKCQQNAKDIEDLKKTFRRISSLKKIQEIQEINYYQNILKNTNIGVK